MKRSALITGSSKGLGRILANVFSENGYDIILHGRDYDGLMKTKDDVLSNRVDAHVVQGDLRDENTIRSLIGHAAKRDISVLVNNAADSRIGVPFEEMDDNFVDGMVYANLIAPMKLTRGIYSFFLGRGYGDIININSLFALEHKKNATIYSATKWGLRGFSECLRKDAEGKDVGIMDVFLSKVLLPGGTYGMDGREVAEKIYGNYADFNFGSLFFDGRPDEFKSNENGGLKEGLINVEIEKKS